MKQMSPDTQRLYCTFRLDGHLFSVDMLDVKEVTTETTSTPIAHAAKEVVGLVNIRGHVYLALDLRRLLGMPSIEMTQDSRLVLFKPSVGHAFGVVVDEISEIQTAAADLIDEFSSHSSEFLASKLKRVDLVSAVCQLPEELLVILNPRRFLAVVEQNFTESI